MMAAEESAGFRVDPGEASYTPGDRADFDRLYRAAYPRLLGTLTGVLGDRAAAEDCVQDAFVRAYQAWPRWKPDAPAEAWLHRIALNVAVSHRRRMRLREVGELVRRLGRPADAQDPAAVPLREDLLLALRTLPAKQAAAIVLRHYHGYSNREIAVALGVPERTVASRLMAARARLRPLLEASWRSGGAGAGVEDAEMGNPGDARVDEGGDEGG